ncbi:MAG: hypothetical protein V4472_11430 [Pseudomonadota bacterium]
MHKFVTMATTAMVAAGIGLAPQAAHAQAAIEGRVDRLESEMRAVQRKVFPGGTGQYIQPQINPPSINPDLPGSPSDSPVADLSARVNALEGQVTAITGQIETTQHRVQVLEDAFNAYKRTTDARLRVLEDAAASTGSRGGLEPAPATPPAAKPPATGPRMPAPAMGAPAPAGTKAAPGSKPPAAGTKTPAKDPARAAKVAAVEKPPVTADPAEDAYLYGYRLWQAKLYPEAEAQLASVVATYPKHRRASYAQNLLGRSLLEDGDPRAAGKAFYKNYEQMPDGERAPESLYYLAQSAMALKKPEAACKVYDELDRLYAAKISEAMKANVARGRTEAKCK